MITISEAGAKDFPVIRMIAYETWPVAYGDILSEVQLDYMLEKFYSIQMLGKNLTHKKHHFILIGDESGTLGFASYEYQYKKKPITRLHKLYILPAKQRRGVGKLLLAEVEKRAKENQDFAVTLNVNKFNPAYHFYLKNGYEKTGEIDIPIGHDFLMEDYIMEKKI